MKNLSSKKPGLGLHSLVSAILAGALFAPFAQASVNVDVVQKALVAKHARWHAKETWVSKLPRDQIQKILGVINPPASDVEFAAPAKKSARDEESVDWRNQGGINWVSPILNQGNCGSCVAFSTVATLETQVNITSGIPGLNPTFSTQALFACGGGACEFGWMPQLAAKFLQENGVPDEACAPYTMGATGETVACGSICKDASQRTTKIVSFTTPSQGTKDIDSVKAALKHGPLTTTLLVYEDFLTYSSGVYQHTTGTGLGGHAISIVGFDDASRSWIIRNSWGKEWGENGFAHISWDDISGVSNSTWGYDVPSQEGYVALKAPHGRVFLAGLTNMESESTYPQTKKIEVQIFNGDTAETIPVRTASCDDAKCKMQFDTTRLPNGYYQAVAKATWGEGKQGASEHEQFYVFNGTPALTISDAPVAGTDMTKPVTGRIEFTVQSSTGSSVPLSSVVFHVRDESGKEILTRSTDVVLPSMTMGWRSNTVPNGRYEIHFSGRLVTPNGSYSVDGPAAWLTTLN